MNSYTSLTVDEKRNLISDNSSAYVNAAELYCRDENFGDAFKILERGKSRLLIEAYSEQLAKSSGIFEENEISKLNGYKSGIANYSNLMEKTFKLGDEQTRFNLESEQRNLINEYIAYKESLQNKYLKYKTVSQANKLDIERDKKILPEDTAFVEYMVYNSSTVIAFVFDKNNEIKAVRIITPKNFSSLCSLYRELLEYPTLQAMDKDNKYLWKFPDGNYKITIGADVKKGSGAIPMETEEDFNKLKQTLSKNLDEVLLSPIKENISSYSNLIISPDGGLNNVPFETLGFNDKLAIDSFNISYVPSFSVLKLMDEADKKNSELTTRHDLFAMGNAFYGNNDESVARKTLEDFSRRTRGKIDVTELLELKWINLDGTKEEIDRVAKMFGTKKIFSEKSASESNLKSFSRRDELSKYKYLLFALTIAGNKNTVMSLWKVQDKTTAEFVSTFFQKLSEGKSALVAINETKREFLKNPQYQNPAIWAPFLLYGF